MPLDSIGESVQDASAWSVGFMKNVELLLHCVLVHSESCFSR